MGFGGISPWQLLIILAIVIMIFGTKKLRNMGGDIGSAVKGFKKAMGNDEDKSVENKTAEKVEASQSSAVDASKEAEKQKETK